MSSQSPSGLLVSTHDVCWRHETGPGHPERPERLTAAVRGLEMAHLEGAVTWVEAPEADDEALHRVHPASLMTQLRDVAEAGGGSIDADTFLGPHSDEAARRAAGAGLDLIERLEAGEGSAGWSIVRPPGHHATADVQMGFCLINNVAVAAQALRAKGQRVVIVDIDAHHGNGTQDIFYDDPDVLFISFHQYPWYPGTGGPGEVGRGDGLHATVNFPLPAGTSGTPYREGIERVVAPVVEEFEPDWLLVSAGFDGHRADPITDLGLTSADYADMVADLLSFAPPGRRLFFLEGGYDLRALADSTGAVASVLVGATHRPEHPTSGGPGHEIIDLAHQIHVERRDM